MRATPALPSLPPAFDRAFFGSDDVASRIGEGGVGGKAAGLLRARDVLAAVFPDGAFRGMALDIPRLVVLGTGVFDAFLARNDLGGVALSGEPDDRIAHAFQRADLPPEVLGDLRSLAAEARRPLAVRSSSLLEDALDRPFAGVYETKMLPNNQPSADARFLRLVEAIKLVYASTYFRAARSYRRAAGAADADEKMAVVIQEVVGDRYDDRFYPQLSAVCRSYSYYPVGGARPEDGVASLALGLGKTIVDGGLCWSYSPRHPATPPPFGSTEQLLRGTQTRFWAVNMGRPPAYDPIAETEYLVEGGLDEAERDGTLRHLASTYDPAADRLRPGIGVDGPRALDFAPLLRLRERPVNELVLALLAAFEDALETAVEIELAAVLPDRVGFVQVRPMRAPEEVVDIDAAELEGAGVLLASRRSLGNGVADGIRDVVYVRPDGFEARHTPAIAREVEELNDRLVEAGTPYLLIGFGRWGSSDPALGIPVRWGHVSGARVLVEATVPGMDVEPSQGSHFFHNLSSLRVLFLSVRHGAPGDVDWPRLEARDAVWESDRLRHVRLDRPLEVRVDGRTRVGMVGWR